MYVESRKMGLMNLLAGYARDADVENGLRGAAGEGEGGTDTASSTDTRTLLRKSAASGGCCAARERSLVLWGDLERGRRRVGGRLEREDTCVHSADSR